MMFYPLVTGVQQLRKYFVRVLGIDGSLTTQEANGMTLTRTGEGAYLITWADNPFQFIGANFGFVATTRADLKGYTVVFGDYSSTAKTLAFTIFDSTFTAADLIAAQRVCIEVTFAETGY